MKVDYEVIWSGRGALPSARADEGYGWERRGSVIPVEPGRQLEPPRKTQPRVVCRVCGQRGAAMASDADDGICWRCVRLRRERETMEAERLPSRLCGSCRRIMSRHDVAKRQQTCSQCLKQKR